MLLRLRSGFIDIPEIMGCKMPIPNAHTNKQPIFWYQIRRALIGMVFRLVFRLVFHIKVVIHPLGWLL